LSYIANVSGGICHYRDEIRPRSRSSSILDHFPDIGRRNIEQIKSKYRPIFLIYTSEHLLDIWMLLLSYIANVSGGICHYRDEIRSKSRSSSILDHFPNIGRRNIEQIKSKYRHIFLIYTSEHLLYVWILLLRYIDDAMICTCHCRDEMRSRSSSILDHFPDVGQSSIEQFQSKHRPIFIHNT